MSLLHPFRIFKTKEDIKDLDLGCFFEAHDSNETFDSNILPLILSEI